jgi:membrane-associated protease RseP (regulator of RpoE activity)
VDDAGQLVNGPDGKPQTQEVGFLGIGTQAALVRQPITAVLPFTGEAIGRMASVIVQLPVKVTELAVSLFGGGERDPEGLLGVVGIGRIAGEVATVDAPVLERAGAMISLVASLNIALFLFNLIPLPPLDGGHIAAALIEAIRRGFAKLRGKPDPGPIDTAKIIPVTMVVAVLLIGLFVLTLAADIFKPISIL